MSFKFVIETLKMMNCMNSTTFNGHLCTSTNHLIWPFLALAGGEGSFFFFCYEDNTIYLFICEMSKGAIWAIYNQRLGNHVWHFGIFTMCNIGQKIELLSTSHPNTIWPRSIHSSTTLCHPISNDLIESYAHCSVCPPENAISVYTDCHR